MQHPEVEDQQGEDYSEEDEPQPGGGAEEVGCEKRVQSCHEPLLMSLIKRDSDMAAGKPSEGPGVTWKSLPVAGYGRNGAAVTILCLF
ncbi:hypothetical protein Pres01_26070 [Metapseudomonas resinovorans]|nr:hypothetical protein Pres01_26070 [Pseudomonas resinovorans]